MTDIGKLRKWVEGILFRSGAEHYDRAVDMLVTEALAPLVRKLEAIEEIINDHDYAAGAVYDIKRILDDAQ